MVAGSRGRIFNAPFCRSKARAEERIEDWRIDYNTIRPQSSLGDRTPREFAAGTGLG
jgi:putative transposase